MSHYSEIELEANRCAQVAQGTERLNGCWLNIYDNWAKNMFFCWGILFSGDNWPRLWSCRLLILEAVEAGLRRQSSDSFNIQSTPAHWTNDSLSSTPRHDPSGNLRQPCVKKAKKKKVSEQFLGRDYVIIRSDFFPPEGDFSVRWGMSCGWLCWWR